MFDKNISFFKQEKKEKEEKKYEKYSINEMWIMSEKKIENPFITNHKTEEEFVNKFLESSHKWKVANPEANVNIWYDSKNVTKEQIEATQKILKEKAESDPSWDIKLKDIREINVIKNNMEIFSNRIPPYEVVDLTKLVILLNETEDENNDCVIFADLEVGDLRPLKDRMTKEELLLFFDKNTSEINEYAKSNFELYGFMQNDNQITGYLENQYFQLSNKPETLLALKIYINHMLDCIQTALNTKWAIPNWDNQQLKERALTDLNGMVYMKQSLLFTLILSLNSQTPIYITEPSGEKVPYDPEQHKIFGNYNNKSDLSFSLRKGVGNLMDTSNNENLPIWSIEVDTVTSPTDLKPCGSSVTFPETLNLNEEDEMDNRTAAFSYKKQFSRNCDVRGGHAHRSNISELDTTTGPGDGTDTYKVQLISTLPKEPEKSFSTHI